MQKLSIQNAELDKKLEPLIKQYDQLQEKMEENINGKVIVENMAYSGVRISIGNVTYIIKNSEHHCQFVKDKADIKVLGLN